MKEHEFTIILASAEESEDDANRLYEAGCADGAISTSNGVIRIDFHRKAVSLEDAIRSAIGNVQDKSKGSGLIDLHFCTL